MQLTRERIITAAVELIEGEGVDAVSMRRIATELGCGVMSLYNHVPSKAALLDGVAERVISSIDAGDGPGDVTGVAGAGWADEVRAQARAFRQIARAYPRCTMVAVSRPTMSTSEPPPVSRALATLHGAGFGDEDALRIVRAFVAYVVGSLLREVGVSPSVARQEQPEQALHPNTDHDADFEFGLDLLVRAVADMRSPVRH
jgi:AcrR family transcriptional regulator